MLDFLSKHSLPAVYKCTLSDCPCIKRKRSFVLNDISELCLDNHKLNVWKAILFKWCHFILKGVGPGIPEFGF